MHSPYFNNSVDSHHKVLSAWANHREGLSKAPRLITLDHHTDTSKPFRRHIAKTIGRNISIDDFNNYQNTYLKNIDFKKPETITKAISLLNNDEHIITAIKTDIISSAFVVAHSAANTNLETYNTHKIICHAVDEVEVNDKPQPQHDIVLESYFLNKAIDAFDKILVEAKEESLLLQPYILDIDLDYFNTFKSVNPDDAKTFIALVKNASLITIATEPEYVKHCAIDDGLSSEHLLKSLEALF